MLNVVSVFAQEKSNIQLDKKKYYETIQNLDKAITIEPNSGILYLNRAYALMMIGSYEKALLDYNVAYEKTLAFDALVGIQWAEFSLEHYEKSILIGEQILDQVPNHYYVLYRMAEAYFFLKDYSKAYQFYGELIDSHGETGYLVWKKGLSAYYLENYIKADALFKRAYALEPSHPGIEYSYNNSKVYPYFVINPEITSFQFKGSDFLGKGERAGINIGIGLDSDWSFRVGASRDVTQNLNSSKGVENYFFDPLAFVYYNYYRYTPANIGTYITQPINLYNVNNLLSEENYVTNKGSLGITYRLSEKYSLSTSGNYLSSNSKYLHGGGTGQIGIVYTNFYSMGFNLSAISHPQSKGGQGSYFFSIPFFEYFYSTSTITGQSMKVDSSEIQFYSLSPPSTYTENITRSRNYGFFQQEFGFNSKYFFTSLGGRVGKARNPLFGESWIYPGFDLLNGGYGRIGVRYSSFTLQVDVSRDFWLDSRNDRPVSDTIKLSLVGAF